MINSEFFIIKLIEELLSAEQYPKIEHIVYDLPHCPLKDYCNAVIELEKFRHKIKNGHATDNNSINVNATKEKYLPLLQTIEQDFISLQKANNYSSIYANQLEYLLICKEFYYPTGASIHEEALLGGTHEPQARESQARELLVRAEKLAARGYLPALNLAATLNFQLSDLRQFFLKQSKLETLNYNSGETGKFILQFYVGEFQKPRPTSYSYCDPNSSEYTGYNEEQAFDAFITAIKSNCLPAIGFGVRLLLEATVFQKAIESPPDEDFVTDTWLKHAKEVRDYCKKIGETLESKGVITSQFDKTEVGIKYLDHLIRAANEDIKPILFKFPDTYDLKITLERLCNEIMSNNQETIQKIKERIPSILSILAKHPAITSDKKEVDSPNYRRSTILTKSIVEILIEQLNEAYKKIKKALLRLEENGAIKKENLPTEYQKVPTFTIFTSEYSTEINFHLFILNAQNIAAEMKNIKSRSSSLYSHGLNKLIQIAMKADKFKPIYLERFIAEIKLLLKFREVELKNKKTFSFFSNSNDKDQIIILLNKLISLEKTILLSSELAKQSTKKEIPAEVTVRQNKLLDFLATLVEKMKTESVYNYQNSTNKILIDFLETEIKANFSISTEIRYTTILEACYLISALIEQQQQIKNYPIKKALENLYVNFKELTDNVSTRTSTSLRDYSSPRNSLERSGSVCSTPTRTPLTLTPSTTPASTPSSSRKSSPESTPPSTPLTSRKSLT